MVERWVRPGNGGPAAEHWTHSTSGGGNVFDIAAGIGRGSGPFHLRYAPLAELIQEHGIELGIGAGLAPTKALAMLEKKLEARLAPAWTSNRRAAASRVMRQRAIRSSQESNE